MLDDNFIPQKPFVDFKWQWASYTPSESINDPVVLLGVLFRMRKLEGKYKYSSEEFDKELRNLSADISDSIGINLSGRGGSRNIIRNSGQYWKALNLIPSESRGLIKLTDFGRKVANHEISQTEFSALTVMSLQLPNPAIQSSEICQKWAASGIRLFPLRLILSICHQTNYLTTDELQRVIIPLSGVPGMQTEEYIRFVLMYREGKLDISRWPNCCIAANDRRMAREFLLFLSNYGYLEIHHQTSNKSDKFFFNKTIEDEILSIINGHISSPGLQQTLGRLKQEDIISDVERKRMQRQGYRPNQAKFRKEVLQACQRCIITNVCMPEVLEAAHIKPFKYKGEDTVANGLAMRMDIHMLFDTGNLRIAEDGTIELSQRARLDYGALIPPRIVIPNFINRDFLRWRWENYNGM